MDKITIIGCGSVGASLAYLITLKNSEGGFNKLSTLVLMDNDIIEKKDMPLFTTKSDVYIGINKANTFKYLFDEMNPSFEIISIPQEFPCNDVRIYNTFMIDCRDTQNQNCNCNLKLNIDESYGLINTKPGLIKIKDINEKNIERSRYVIKNSKYYALKFSMFVLENFIIGKHYDQTKNLFSISMNHGGVNIYAID